jgi:hypothetical protein
MMKTPTEKPTIPLNYSSRENLLSANSELIAQLQGRLKAKRFRPQEGDSLKLAYMRVFLQALQVQNSILKDLELEELKQRLEALEAMQAESLEKEQVYTPDYEIQNEEENEYIKPSKMGVLVRC